MASKFLLLPTKQKRELVSVLCRATESLTEETSQRGKNPDKNAEIKEKNRNAIKMLTFLCCTVVNGCEKALKKETDKWDWAAEKENLFGVLMTVLKNEDVPRLWNMNTPEEEFGNMFFKTALMSFETSTKTDHFTKTLFEIISLALKQYKSLKLTFSATFTHILLNRERFVPKIVKLCVYMIENHSLNDVIGNIIREIGRLDDQNLNKNLKGSESLGLFLTEIAQKHPVLVFNNFEGLLKFLGGASYKMRNGVIDLIGELIINLEVIIEELSDIKLEGVSSENENTESPKNYKKRVRAAIYEKALKLLEIVEGRTMDIVTYTRSKSLQVLKRLVETESIPFSEHLIKIVKLAKGKLLEKNANIRKNAAGLLCALMVKNYPRNEKDFAKRKEQLEDILNVVNSAEQSIKIEAGSKKLSEKSRKKLEKELESVARACEFAREVRHCFPEMCKVLASNGNFDVVEVIKFFVAASELEIDGWKSGFKKMFSLIWNKENPNIVDAVIDAFYEKYIQVKDSDGHPNEDTIAQKFALLIGEMESYKELACIEEVIVIMTKKEKIPDTVVFALCRNFESKNSKFEKVISSAQAEPFKLKPYVESASNSLYILSIIASIRPELLSNLIDRLVGNVESAYEAKGKSPIGSHFPEYVLLFKHVFSLIEKCNKKNPLSGDTIARVEKFAEKIVFAFSIRDDEWYPVSQQVVSTLFALMPEPQEKMGKIVKKFGEKAQKTLSTAHLSRFLFLFGAIAIGTLVVLEKDEMRLKALKSKKEREQQIAESKRDKRKSSILSDYYKMNEGEKEYQIEQMREKAEQSMVKNDLIGAYRELVLYLCNNLAELKDNRLKCSSILALSKLMCISQAFCNENLSLLFSVLENKETNSTLVTNIIISLGDIVSRFPNLAAPYVSRMFAPLKHKEVSVRKNTLLVISHLILNDMIKVKELTSEIALAITDTEKSVRDLAKLFFQEFSKKGKNPVYNTLPDIVSKLTHDKVKKGVFKEVMKELIRYVSEEKQQENLIIKICARFYKLKDRDQIRNNVYCLTLLNYGEKCFRKLSEMSKTYKNLFSDRWVYEAFRAILMKAKKVAVKQEVKDLISEFENKVLNQRPENRENSPESAAKKKASEEDDFDHEDVKDGEREKSEK